MPACPHNDRAVLLNGSLRGVDVMAGSMMPDAADLKQILFRRDALLRQQQSESQWPPCAARYRRSRVMDLNLE